MDKSADRFFKGFSLEGYKLQILINALENERRQCLNRLKEEKHIFKMSIKAPVKCGEECWSQYGEIFHANGDKRDNSSITKIDMEQHNDGTFLPFSYPRPNNKENRYEVLYMQNYHEMWQHISFQLKQLELYRHHKKRVR